MANKQVRKNNLKAEKYLSELLTTTEFNRLKRTKILFDNNSIEILRKRCVYYGIPISYLEEIEEGNIIAEEKILKNLEKDNEKISSN